MRNRLYALLLKIMTIIISAGILISSQCTTTSQPNDNIQDIHVQVVEPVNTTAKVEQFPLPNCGGTDKLVQSLGAYASVIESATVGAKATTTSGGEVQIPETVKLKLEIQVELAYRKTLESANSRVDSIEMSAAAGTHVVYTILWERKTFNSIVQYSADGKVYESPYTYQLSVPKIDTSYNVACSSDNDKDESVLSTPAPTNTSLPTSPQLVPTKSPILSKTFDIYANARWQNTGVYVEVDDELEIIYVSGQWSGRVDEGVYTGPDNPPVDNDFACMLMPHSQVGYNALIGRIGSSDPFKVGTRLIMTSSIAGTLELRMNDCDEHLTDNDGFVRVEIMVRR